MPTFQPFPRGVVKLGAKEQNKIAELTEHLNKLGEINITAIEDYELVRERYKFLQKQQEDLHNSIASFLINKLPRYN